MMYYILKYLLYFPVKFFWLERMDGFSNIPKSSFILAANHASYLDFILLFILVPRKISFLAAEKFFKNPIWFVIMKITGQIKVDRTSSKKDDVYIAVDNVFKNNRVLGIFPEGTRSRNGFLNKAYCGVAKFSYKYKVPVLPVGISGTFDCWPPYSKFPKFKKCSINIGQPIFINSVDFDLETQKIMRSIAILSDQKYEY